jgi:hypothetical protein
MFVACIVHTLVYILQNIFVNNLTQSSHFLTLTKPIPDPGYASTWPQPSHYLNPAKPFSGLRQAITWPRLSHYLNVAKTLPNSSQMLPGSKPSHYLNPVKLLLKRSQSTIVDVAKPPPDPSQTTSDQRQANNYATTIWPLTTVYKI